MTIQKQADTEQSPTTTIDTTLIATINQEISQDTFQSEEVKYPKQYDTNFIAKLLITGTYQSGEYWDNAENEKWFGLFINNLGAYLNETKIKIKKEFYTDYDNGEVKRIVWDVQTVNKNKTIILITGIDVLTNLKIKQPDLSKNEIFPGDTLKFNYLGVDYKIYATGSTKKVDHRWFGIRNYKLYLTANKNGQVITELLVSQPILDTDMITIKFAGDIDGDGFLDLLIDTKMYAITNLVLYLSKPAYKGHLLKVVGQYQSYGC